MPITRSPLVGCRHPAYESLPWLCTSAAATRRFPVLVPLSSRATCRPFLLAEPMLGWGHSDFLCACLGRQLWSVSAGKHPRCCISTFRWAVRARLASQDGAGQEAVLQLTPSVLLRGEAGCPVRATSDPEGNALQLSIPHNLLLENPNYKFRFLLGGMIWKEVVIIKR